MALVTGATAGIGRAIALGLARSGFHVVVGCRDARRGEEVADELRRETGTTSSLMVADLSLPREVRAACASVQREVPRLDVLVNNAGGWSTRRVETPDGVERTWATNVLAYHLVTRLWEEPLAAARGRVVFVASGLAHSLSLDDPEFRRRPYSGLQAYAQSKQANRMMARAFARRLEARGVVVNSMHPDFTRTGAFSAGGGFSGWVAGLGARLFGRSPHKAADTALWLATSAEVQGVTGGYFHERRELGCPFVNEAAEDALFSLCERQCSPATELATEFA